MKSINRKELVRRHNPSIFGFEHHSPLSVGNGEFAYTVDFTGTQTFPEQYSGGIPLCTMSQWGWHSTPFSKDRPHCDLADLKFKEYDTYGRSVDYPTCGKGQEEVYNWLRMNPHRFHLGRIGFEMLNEEGEGAGLEDLNRIEQRLDLWTGIISSSFQCRGHAVAVSTCCHPQRDILALKVTSGLVSSGHLRIRLSFPYGSGQKSGADWQKDADHRTEVMEQGENDAVLLRLMDSTTYFLNIAWSPRAELVRSGRNSFYLVAEHCDTIQFVCSFSPQPPRDTIPAFSGIVRANEVHWPDFWERGGAVELAESKDQRGLELERRLVLSQYLTAIQCAGSLPPQETGLTCNSWYGKHHLEMHFWHAAHFPLWGRAELFLRSLWWYQSILPKARRTALSQGYDGIRWPKMVGWAGRESPSPINPLLIWQQPHLIYFAELCYRAGPTKATLELFAELVQKTAAFMASFVHHDLPNHRYVLGPPLIPAQENHAPEQTLNPTFELEYWSFGLRTANKWRQRLGLASDQKWEKIAANLAALPVGENVYLAQERCPLTFSEFNFDHPSMSAALGVLPGYLVDKKIMSRTLDQIVEGWKFEKMWGWDFPMLAMTATRLGRPELAVDLLLADSPKNTYLGNGHNRQGERTDLPLYLPGNGGLLLAVALMAQERNGAAGAFLGFPKNGKWEVRQEDLLAPP